MVSSIGDVARVRAEIVATWSKLIVVRLLKVSLALGSKGVSYVSVDEWCCTEDSGLVADIDNFPDSKFEIE